MEIRHCHLRQTRNGLTLIEVLVILAILGVLLSILLPAIQQARESSRRVSCKNNLRQFGIGLSSHAEMYGAFPTSQRPDTVLQRLLPYFGEAALEQALRTTLTTGVPDSLFVEAYGCPDDPVVWQTMSSAGGASYYLNEGTQFNWGIGPLNGFCKSINVDVTPAEILDGLSQTVAMSERLVVPERPAELDPAVTSREPKRFFWWTEVRYTGPGNEALAIDQCRNHRTTTFPQVWGLHGRNFWISVGGYNHLLPPNHHGCYNGPEDLQATDEDMLIPASSNHPGGVHSLLADGSVHFISESIDEGVWQALGTRNGAESFTPPF